MVCSNVMCKQLSFVGKAPCNPNISRKNNITIKRNNISYIISINTFEGEKTIKIYTENTVPFDSIFSTLCEIIRFENLFDGLFFTPISIIADSVECVDAVLQSILPFYISNEKKHTCFNLRMNDNEYANYFDKWTEYGDKLKIVHQVYLYNAFVKGNPMDIRISLLLEVFEPLSKILKNEGKITITRPKTTSKKCPKCNAVIKGKTLSPTLYNRLDAITDIYKKTIFKGVVKDQILTKAVNLRNRVFHVNGSKKDYLNGIECGLYFYKFALMYRCIIFSLLGLKESEYMSIAEKWITDFDAEYGYLLNMP